MTIAVERLQGLLNPTGQVSGHVSVFRWVLTDADGNGAYITIPNSPDRSVQVFGTFNSGTVTIQGTNEPDPLNPQTLHAPDGGNLAFTAAGIEAILENPMKIRPVLSGTAGAASVAVLIMSRG